MPRPPEAASFMNSLVDALLDKVAPSLTLTILWKFGRKLLVFDTTEQAENVKKCFPCEMTYFGRKLTFDLVAQPIEFTGFKV